MNTPNARSLQDTEVIKRFFEYPSEQSFEEMFQTFTPQLVAYFRSRRCDFFLAQDLAQEVMLALYRKSGQIRDRSSFRGWIFKVARSALSRHYDKASRSVRTLQLAAVSDRVGMREEPAPTGTPAFEFLRWIALLDSRESEVMKLKFIEQWEYHEIAAAQAIPIGTVQSRVFTAKKKLASLLISGKKVMDRAA
jgi:RNA polymerase sigma-70 factor (ECF subfamily)